MVLVWLFTQSSGADLAVYTIQWCWFGCLHNPLVLVWLFTESSGADLAVYTIQWCWFAHSSGAG